MGLIITMKRQATQSATDVVARLEMDILDAVNMVSCCNHSPPGGSAFDYVHHNAVITILCL